MENIIKKDSLELFMEDMVAYAIAVSLRRQFPDGRDSFKPSQRRIIYTLHKKGVIEPNVIKSQRIVGDTMAFHPHGDSSIYDAMPLLGNMFQIKLPILYLSGNWGTVMGDKQAAARYTECGLSKFAEKNVMGELSKNSVEWAKNFDGTEEEPMFLPVKLPLLLINGSTGLAVGKASNIPRHNPIEVIEATQSVILDMMNGTDLAQVVLVPDQCLNTEVINTDWAKISNTGAGSFKVRGIIETGEYEKYPALFVKSLPDRVSTGDIMDKMNKLAADKKLSPMIRRVIDLSDKRINVNLVIQLEKGTDIEFAKQYMYKKCGVQQNFTVDMNVVVGYGVKRFSYKEYLQYFIHQRCMTKKGYYSNLKHDTDTRLHKLSTFIQVMKSGDIDYIISKIRGSKEDADELVEFLVTKYNFTDLQCKFILDTSIKNLSLSKLQEYENEVVKLEQDSKFYEEMFLDTNKRLQAIYDELTEIKEDILKTPEIARRKTVVISDDLVAEVPSGMFKIVITNDNHIRKLPVDAKVNTIKGDYPKFIVDIDNRDSLILFSAKGKVYKLPVHRIPLCDKSGAGTIAGAIIKGLTADIVDIVPDSVIQNICAMDYKPYVTVLTKDNYVKKIDITDIQTVSLSGIMYVKLGSADSVVSINIVDDRSDVVIYSTNKAMRCPMSKIPLYKRASQGVKAMNTTNPIEGMDVIYPDCEYVVVTTANGNVNKYNIAGLESGDRNKAGNSVIRLKKGDSIVNIASVSDSNTLEITTTKGVQQIPIADIPLGTSTSGGKKMITTKGDVIVSVRIIR